MSPSLCREGTGDLRTLPSPPSLSTHWPLYLHGVLFLSFLPLPPCPTGDSNTKPAWVQGAGLQGVMQALTGARVMEGGRGTLAGW